MSTQTFPLSGLHCANCVRKISQALAPFADQVEVTLEPMQVRLTGLKSNAQFSEMQSAVQSSGNYRLEANLEQKMPISAVDTTQLAITNVASADASWRTYYPLLLILSFIFCASVLVQLGHHSNHGMGMSALSCHETMRYFMAGFFLVFAFFKLLDLQAFADAYSGYDLLAARWRPWGLLYPFVELGLGMAYLANFAPTATAWITIVVMGFSAIGVIHAVTQKRKIRCACLGAVFNLPMSTVTIVEDVGMVLMAAVMLPL